MITTLLMAIVYVLAPGPVNVAIVRYSIRDGFRQGLAVSLGALGGDVLYALLVFSGMSMFLNYLPLQILLTVGGIVVLVYMGVQSLRPSTVQPLARPPYALQRPTAASGATHSPAGRAAEYPPTMAHEGTKFWQALRDGMLLVIANPLGMVFWSTLATSAAVDSGYQQLDLLLGFFSMVTLLSVSLVLIACQFKGLLSPRGLLGISRLCGVVLIGLGLRLGLFLLELV